MHSCYLKTFAPLGGVRLATRREILVDFLHSGSLIG